VFASPLARRLAKDAGIPVTEIPGTGPGGRITRSDVEAVVSERAVRPTPSAPAANLTTPPKVSGPEATPASSAAAKGAGFTDIPHSRIRRAVAQRLTESKQSIPHFYLQGSAQVDKLLKLRSQLNAAGGVKISVNDMVIKAAAHAYTIIPAMNVIWTADATRQFDHVDMSVAIATDRGLVTPVLRSVEQLSVGTVATRVKDFVERAREGKLRQNELEGGAFSITNLGMFGVEDFSAIINPPQSAILAVGAARQEPIVRDGELTVGTVMKFTLSVDHRAIDGALAAEWLRTFVAVFSDPIQTLL
jgi:pyruvate dehydrogenase E2 component (dihydrolipoamide acetyltransferase)